MATLKESPTQEAIKIMSYQIRRTSGSRELRYVKLYSTNFYCAFVLQEFVLPSVATVMNNHLDLLGFATDPK